ncbi:MAG: EpsI family protein [Gallionellaceae bacterium]|nr:EpsI family protein [Gallionellaceae bacterium]
MKGLSFKYLLIGVVMLAAAGLAVALKPTHKVADQGPKINLETMIPKQFGDWRMVDELDRMMVSPEVRAKLDRIYNQTLTRTYIDGKGARVMLSIAYGGDQSDAMQMHKPEVCYPAQGFHVLKDVADGLIQGPDGPIPVRRLVASQGARNEPITYWMRVGQKVTGDGLPKKLEQLRYGLTGRVPDGLLFRVSSIGQDSDKEYVIQEQFIKSLLMDVSEAAKTKLLGKAS